MISVLTDQGRGTVSYHLGREGQVVWQDLQANQSEVAHSNGPYQTNAWLVFESMFQAHQYTADQHNIVCMELILNIYLQMHSKDRQQHSEK